MFPKLDSRIESESKEGSLNGKTSFLFDFSKGDFVTIDGRVTEIDELEAVKVWLEKVLRTQRSKFKIYEDSEYGVRLTNLVYNDYPLDFIKMEMEREVREALAKNSDIQNVHSFAFERTRGYLACTFTVDTKYGQTGGEVNV